MAQPMDIAWMVLKQEAYDEQALPSRPMPAAPQPHPMLGQQMMEPPPTGGRYFEMMAPPKGSPARLQYLFGRASKGNLTPEEQAEFISLGGM